MVNPEGKVCKKEQGTNKGPIVCTIVSSAGSILELRYRKDGDDRGRWGQHGGDCWRSSHPLSNFYVIWVRGILLSQVFASFCELWLSEPYFFSFWACPQPKDKTVFVVQVNQVFCFLRGYDWLPVGLWHLTMDAPENSWEPICNVSNPSLASVALATAMGSTHGKEHHVTIKYVHSHKN